MSETNSRPISPLRGRMTGLRPVPANLKPIFIDRGNFTGGSSLTEATMSALDASEALIVVRSTISATRPAVQEEVRLFRLRHPDRPVIPVVIGGKAPDNFPPGLRFAVNADGAIGTDQITILGPDLRETGDGRELGLAKVVAGLPGFDNADDICRRAVRAQRRTNQMYGVMAVVFLAVAAGGGGYFAWDSHRTRQQNQQTVDAIIATLEKLSPVVNAQTATPRTTEGLTAAITAAVQGASTDPRMAQALALLKAGKPKEAEPLFDSVAADKVKRVQQDSKDAAAAYRNAAAIKEVSDPKNARQDYANAAKLDPDNVEAMFQNGYLQQHANALADADTAFRRVLVLGKPGRDDDRLIYSHFGLGDILVERGALDQAFAEYKSGGDYADKLAISEPNNTDWQRYLSLS